ncbi:glycosyltransferase [Flavobacterium sp. 123]|uniref:glycosyltransferase n=1 Tax=Flavobacterium sp. 123 TaxID=2135627 RepID=UPI000EAFE60A|nr:glycosyltransferase [Flavobacterium sp. 123]RKS99654.1 undecaprenyl-phosphate 4-deoxy-4-formamido-L-arabinose transferase [Flavobacterium sp. 123]
MIDLDIVIPVYNSSLNVSSLIERLNSWANETTYKFQVIFVDDCSNDNSIKKIISEPKAFEYKLIQLAKNYGQHTATAVGLSKSSAPYVATIDDDLQHDPFELENLLKMLIHEDIDLVYGVYQKKEHAAFRNFGSSLLKRILRLAGLNYNMVTSFRLMKSKVTKTFKNTSVTSIIFIDEYLTKIAKNQSSCLVNHFSRKEGQSNYSTWKLVKFALKIILFHTAIPLRFITRFGLVMAIVFFMFGFYFTYNKIANNVPLGYSSLIVALFFSTGMILLSLGIIGEYIRKIWISQNKLDQVIILE